MTGAALLDDLAAAGVRLSLAGDDLDYQARLGVSIAPHTARITAHKPMLPNELRLREQIVAAVTVEPKHFHRAEYDRLWALWHAQDATKESTS